MKWKIINYWRASIHCTRIAQNSEYLYFHREIFSTYKRRIGRFNWILVRTWANKFPSWQILSLFHLRKTSAHVRTSMQFRSTTSFSQCINAEPRETREDSQATSASEHRQRRRSRALLFARRALSLSFLKFRKSPGCVAPRWLLITTREWASERVRIQSVILGSYEVIIAVRMNL